jgi:hypothetical protein
MAEVSGWRSKIELRFRLNDSCVQQTRAQPNDLDACLI